MKFVDNHQKRIIGVCLAFLWISVLAACAQVAGPIDSHPASIRVVMDNNYPPYIFLNDQGFPSGILVDQWKLWETKTGVKVIISAVPWADALSRMEAGKYDVIDTIFYTKERAKIYDFSAAYARIDVPIFFRNKISGLATANDLKGFRVAVKTGDSDAKYLEDAGVANLVYYSSYEGIMQAVQRGDENIFVIDQPPGLYLLYKYGLQKQFNTSEPLFSGAFHRAVKKGDSALFHLVKNGFDKISAEEYKAIENHWLGVGPTSEWQKYLLNVGMIGLFAVFVILLLFIFNRVLQNRVRQRTQELEQALLGLKNSENKYRTIFNATSEAIFVLSQPGGEILHVNEAMLHMYGYESEEQVQAMDIGYTYSDIRPYTKADAEERILKTLAEGPQVFEWLSRRRNGETFWSEVSLQSSDIDGEKQILVVVRDITARKQAEEQNQRLINMLPSGVIVHSQGRIMFVNRAGSQFFGATLPEQLVGASLLERIHPDFHGQVQERIQRLLDRDGEVEQLEEKLIRLDGSGFDAEVATIALSYAGQASVLSVFNDITRRKRHEYEVEVITTLSAVLRTAPTRAEMLPEIVKQLVGLLHCDAASIEIIDPITGEAVVEASQGVWSSLQGTRQKQGTGMNAIVSATLRPYHAINMEIEPDLAYPDWAYTEIKNSVGVPLLAQEKLIGYIWIGRKTAIVDYEIRLLSAIADISANAIHRVTLYEQTEKDAAALALAYDTTLEGWARALELRDQETEGHTRRVVETTLQLALALGIPKNQMEHVRRGALLHDIGKMGIPDSVLLKPGTLNDREWEIMHRHPEYAYNLLSPISYLRPALDIPFCHHEKWNGSGYPRGLKGSEIPMTARIFAIVDVWDALTNDRPYRSAWTRKKTYEYIRQQVGYHFDPEVAEVFFKMIVP